MLLKQGYKRPTSLLLPLSPPNPSSITPLQVTLPTKEVVVESTPPTTLPSDASPAASETNGASAVDGIQQPPLQTPVSSQLVLQAVAHAIAVTTPTSLPVITPAINASTSDVGTQSSGRRRRSRVRVFIKNIFRRP